MALSGSNEYRLRCEDYDEKEEEFIQSLQKELGKCRTSSRRSFFITLGIQLYSVRSSLAEEGDFPYIIFRIMLSKIPLSHSKYGITIMDKEQALQSFIESFYSNTELSRSAAAAMDQSGSSSVPLMITGEIGTGKDRVAYLHYAKSQFNDEPLYVVNCSMLNDKTWNFLINHYNSPFTDNGNTIYISNLGVLSHQRQTGHQPAHPQPSDLFLYPGKGRSYAPCCIGVYQYAGVCASSYQAFTGAEK